VNDIKWLFIKITKK